MTARRHFAALADQPPPHRVLQGLDYQGRHPEAAEACTDVGSDRPDIGPGRDDLAGFRGILISLALVGSIVATVLALHWTLA